MVPILPFGAGGVFTIARSLRTRGSANAGLYRAVATTTNRRTYTLSRWFKLGTLDQGFALWQGYINASNWTSFIVHASSRQFSFAQADGGVGNWSVISTAAFRDPGAWYHVVIQVDTTDATATNRVRAWVNGVAVPLSVSGAGFPSLNKDTHINVSGAQQGFGYEPTNYLLPTDGHHAELHFVDGTLVAPTAFGKTDPATGAWVPIRYEGGYGGANGAFHDFRDATSAATLGHDQSGKGNHLTPSGISVTTGVTYDPSADTPTANWATLNPLRRSQNIVATISAGNARAKSPNGGYYARAVATQGFEDDGVGRYCEFTLTTAHLGVEAFGVTTATAYVNDANIAGTDAGEWAAQGNGATTNIRNNNVNAFTGLALWGAGGVAMIAYRAGKLWLGLNGVWFNAGDPAADTGAVYSGLAGPLFPFCAIGSTTPVIDANFGQRDFVHAPPAGFLRLNARMSIDPAIKSPAAHFKAVTDTGAGIGAASLGSFPNLLVAIKDRANANNWQVMDSVRGANGSNVLQFNTTAANGSYSTPAGNSVGYAFNAGTAPAANTQGTLPSTVCANPTAGFSVVGWTGTGTAGQTVGHGLGAAPKMIIVKKINAAQFWYVAHVGIAGTNFGYHMFLNSAGAISGMNDPYYISGPTATTFSLEPGNANDGGNQSGVQYVAYCWTEIPGFSRIGSYAGNGAADGPFVWCGFRPRLVMLKAVTVGTSWVVYDAARNASNVVNGALYPNLTAVEDTAAGDIDIVAGGFKLREGGGVSTNNSGETYLFLALAETPFKYATAR